MIRGRRPSIHQIGTAELHGAELVLSGWGIGLCASGCACHRHPITGALVLQQDHHGRRLGLASYPPSPAAQPSTQPPRDAAAQPPRPCTCCQPWTATELAAIVRDLADIAALQHQPPAAPSTSN